MVKTPRGTLSYYVAHGTHSGYVYGCRCARCKAAKSAYNKRYRMRNIRDPETPEEWQTAADAANLLLELESCRMYGLIKGGPKANIERCESILDLAANRGIHPRKLTSEEIWHFLNS